MIIFDIEALPPGDRLSMWHDVIWRNYVPLDIRTAVGVSDNFKGEVATSFLSEMRIATTSSPFAHTISRTPRLIKADSESLIMVGRQMAGEGVVRQRRNEAWLRVGDFAIWDTRFPYEIEFTEDWRMQVFQIPAPRLKLNEGIISRSVGKTFSSQDAFNRGISLFLNALSDCCDEDSAASEIVIRSTDLIRTAVERASGELSEGTDTATLRRVLSYIDGKLSTPQLCAGSIAKDFEISVRTLHRLFNQHDKSLSGEIRTRRMEAIARELVHPRHRNRTLGSIARGWGYVDPPNFSREFKRHYGVTPTRWRAAGRTDPPTLNN